ncbi:MAG: histidine kinase, partial [Elusimicrobia bacterium]|nr:histidine kinase [Elusimicrobiota bacterium]
AVECMKHGAMDYIQKPFTEAELLALVKKSLLKRRDRIDRQLKPAVRITHAAAAERERGGEFSIPGGVLVSAGHCWAALAQDGTVKVGLDDFAKKLIGPVDAVEFPNPGMTVNAGQPLFAVRSGDRRVQFHAPVGGKVVRVNTALGEDLESLEMTPYHKNWVCVIEGDALDADVRALKIGRSAVALFEEDLERMRKALGDGAAAGEPLSVGELAKLDDARWARVEKEFFAR